MFLNSNYSQDLLYKDLSQGYDLVRNLISLGDYKSIFLTVLFFKLIKVIKNECNLTSEGGESYAFIEGNKVFFPESADFGYLFSNRFSVNNNDRVLNAIKDFSDKNGDLIGNSLALLYVDTPRIFDLKQSDNLFLNLFDLINNIYNEKNRDNFLVKVGDFFELYISYFSILDSKNSGQSYTQSSLNDLVVQLVAPMPYQTVYDPASGSGALLIKCNELVYKKYKGNSSCLLYGQEKNASTYAIAKLNMFLHLNFSHQLALGDTLLDPKFLDQDRNLMQFDIVISNPPFSISNWGYDDLIDDRFRRFEFGMPPKSKGDFAFILHMIKSMNDSGRMAIISSNGVLFRGASEAKIREALIENNLLDAVIGLPEKLLFSTSVPIVILLFKKNKISKNVKFIDASKKYMVDRNLNYLSEDNVGEIVDAYNLECDVVEFSRIVSLGEIKDNDYNLNISRYIRSEGAVNNVNLDEIKELCENLKDELKVLEVEMQSYIQNWFED